MITRRKPIARSPMKRRAPKRRKDSDLAYLAWLHTQPCVLAFSCAARTVEAAHVGIRGLGQKCPDREAIPLCAYHHRTGRTSNHRLGKLFWEYYDLKRETVLAELHAAYRAETGKEV